MCLTLPTSLSAVRRLACPTSAWPHGCSALGCRMLAPREEASSVCQQPPGQGACYPPCVTIVGEEAAPLTAEHANPCSLWSAAPYSATWKVQPRELKAISEGMCTWNGGAATCCADRAQIASGMYRDSSCQQQRRDIRSFHTCCRTRLRSVVHKKAKWKQKTGVTLSRPPAVQRPSGCTGQMPYGGPFRADRRSHFHSSHACTVALFYPPVIICSFFYTLICTQERVARPSFGSGDSQ